MIAALPLFHRIAGQPVIVLGEGEAAAAKRRLVERAGGVVCAKGPDGGEADCHGESCPLVSCPCARGAAPRLAFVAHDEPAACAADAARLRAAGLLVNVVDQPALCDFTTPSLIDRAPVLIAIGTGGASAGLAKQLRLRLEALLPAGLGALAQALYAARGALRARFPDAGERRRALDAALGEGGALDPLDSASAGRVAGWLAGAGDQPGGLVEIRLRSADPEDLTLREARVLGSADVIAHEPAVPPAVLARARADAVRVVLGDAAPQGAPPPGPGLVVVLRATS